MGDRLNVVNDDLIVPALVHGRADTVGRVDVGVHAETDTFSTFKTAQIHTELGGHSLSCLF